MKLLTPVCLKAHKKPISHNILYPVCLLSFKTCSLAHLIQRRINFSLGGGQRCEIGTTAPRIHTHTHIHTGQAHPGILIQYAAFYSGQSYLKRPNCR